MSTAQGPATGAGYRERLAVVHRWAPQAFFVPGSVLYVGANLKRHDYVQELCYSGNRVTIVEAFPPNAKGLAQACFVERVINADVREVGSLFRDKFDYVAWFNGPEHMDKPDAIETIRALERLTRNTLMFGTPIGFVPQPIVDGNAYELHRSSWTVEDWAELGYSAVALGNADEMGSFLFAWKVMAP